MPEQFAAVAPFYDELMDGVPYVGWVTYLQTLFDEHDLTPIKVLDLACGTGNVTELLTIAGYQMTGVDLAPDMITEAKRKAEEKRLLIEYFVQDAAEMDLPTRDYDLCVSLFDSMNYLTEPADLQSAFHRVRAHLLEDGAFIFDMNSEYALVNQFFDQNNLKSHDPLRYDWVSTYDAETRLCTVTMKFLYRNPETGENHAFIEEHLQYAYKQFEVEAMLKAAGFGKVTTYQAYTLKPTTKTSDRIFYVAKI